MTRHLRSGVSLVEIVILIGLTGLVLMAVRSTLANVRTDADDKQTIAELGQLLSDAEVRAATLGRYGQGYLFDDVWAAAPGGRNTDVNQDSGTGELDPPQSDLTVLAQPGTATPAVVPSLVHGYVSVAVELDGRQIVLATLTSRGRCAWIHAELGTVLTSGAVDVPAGDLCAADDVLGPAKTAVVPAPAAGWGGAAAVEGQIAP